jgi:glycosyltransferase involved in cell wall biosynthesis
MSELSVVIPAFNEREAVAQVIERLLAVRDALRLEAGIRGLEILVVDDGSTDDTGAVVAWLAQTGSMNGATVRLIRHAENRGYGAALQTGFAHARGHLLAFMDADSTYPPEHLPALCRAARTRGTGLVLGDRMSGGASHMPLLRRLGNALLAALTSLLAGTRVADCCSGMRVLPLATWKKLGVLPEGLDFTPAMTMRALHQQIVVREVGIPYHERIGRSKLKVVRDGMRFLLTILRETWRCRPDRFWALAGPVALSVLGLAGVSLAVAGAYERPWSHVGLSLLLGAAVCTVGLSLASRRTSLRPAAFRQVLAGVMPRVGRAARREEEQAPS